MKKILFYDNVTGELVFATNESESVIQQTIEFNVDSTIVIVIDAKDPSELEEYNLLLFSSGEIKQLI